MPVVHFPSQRPGSSTSPCRGTYRSSHGNDFRSITASCPTRGRRHTTALPKWASQVNLLAPYTQSVFFKFSSVKVRVILTLLFLSFQSCQQCLNLKHKHILATKGLILCKWACKLHVSPKPVTQVSSRADRDAVKLRGKFMLLSSRNLK